MDKQLIERIALEVCDGIPLEMKMHLPGYSVRFAERFLPRIDAERGKDAKAWLHGSRPESDVITTAVRNVWNGVVLGQMAAYNIPLFLSPAPEIPEGMALVQIAITDAGVDAAGAECQPGQCAYDVASKLWEKLIAAQGERNE